MSTSLLYHGFSIRGYRYVRTEYVESGGMFALTQDPEMCRARDVAGGISSSKAG